MVKNGWLKKGLIVLTAIAAGTMFNYNSVNAEDKINAKTFNMESRATAPLDDKLFHASICKDKEDCYDLMPDKDYPDRLAKPDSFSGKWFNNTHERLEKERKNMGESAFWEFFDVNDKLFKTDIESQYLNDENNRRVDMVTDAVVNEGIDTLVDEIEIAQKVKDYLEEFKAKYLNLEYDIDKNEFSEGIIPKDKKEKSPAEIAQDKQFKKWEKKNKEKRWGTVRCSLDAKTTLIDIKPQFSVKYKNQPFAATYNLEIPRDMDLLGKGVHTLEMGRPFKILDKNGSINLYGIKDKASGEMKVYGAVTFNF